MESRWSFPVTICSRCGVRWVNKPIVRQVSPGNCSSVGSWPDCGRRRSSPASQRRHWRTRAGSSLRRDGKPKLELISLGLSYPYRKLSADEARVRLARISRLKSGTPFVLHVGSNLRRKNREGVLRIFARCKTQWDGLLVIRRGTALGFASLVRPGSWASWIGSSRFPTRRANCSRRFIIAQPLSCSHHASKGSAGRLSRRRPADAR